MPILPVIDLMHGHVVRGVAGRRDEYRPIVSRLTNSTAPLEIAWALRQTSGCTQVYVADLDAIGHGSPSLNVYQTLHSLGLHLWIDAGIASANAAVLPALSAVKADVIVGLESVESPNALREIVARVGHERVVFSLDLKAGKPLGAWQMEDPDWIAEHAIERCGVGRLIVLDLASVGVGQGVGAEGFCVDLKRRYPRVQLTAGGGVRHIKDVKRLLDIGVEYVLVASALHDGRITPEDVKSL